MPRMLPFQRTDRQSSHEIPLEEREYQQYGPGGHDRHRIAHRLQRHLLRLQKKTPSPATVPRSRARSRTPTESAAAGTAGYRGPCPEYRATCCTISSHLPWKNRNAMAARAGVDIGSATRRQMVISRAPSMRADSNTSSGNCVKKVRMMMTKNALDQNGKDVDPERVSQMVPTRDDDVGRYQPAAEHQREEDDEHDDTPPGVVRPRQDVAGERHRQNAQSGSGNGLECGDTICTKHRGEIAKHPGVGGQVDAGGLSNGSRTRRCPDRWKAIPRRSAGRAPRTAGRAR